MANERVSQLLEIFANDLAQNDLFLLTDMSQRESKKLQLGQMMLYFGNSGSFSTTSASYANWAGGAYGSNIVGPVTSASYSDASHLSDSASYSLFSKSGSAALYADRATTASYTLAGGGGSTVSASHADRADWADNAAIASYLYYSGVDNGIVSNALTCSYANDLQVWYGGATPSPNGHGITIREAVNDGVTLLMSGSVDGGEFIIRTFDNATEPVRFQGWNYTGVPSFTVDRAILTGTPVDNTAKWTVYGEMSASAYTASKSSGVGFVGTASCAVTASYAENLAGGSVKAWAFVTWSAAHVSSCSLYRSRNVASVAYMTSSHPNLANTLDHFIVTFSSPMQNANYMLVGNTIGYVSNYLGVPINAVLTHNPLVDEDALLVGCTMSLWITSSMRSLFYGGQTQANFQILG